MNDDNKVFVPLSLENLNVKAASYFLSASKGVYIIVAVLPWVFIVPYMASLTPQSVFGMILGLAFAAIFMVFFIRFVVFEENTFKRIFKDLENNKISGVDKFWAVDWIDNNGNIHYKYKSDSGLRKAIVLKLSFSPRIGKDEGHENRFRASIKTLINGILQEGISCDIYEASEPRQIPKNLQYYFDKATTIEDPYLKEFMLDHINSMAIKVKKRKRIKSIYVILYFSDPKKFRVMNDIANKLTRSINSKEIYKVCKILQKDDVEKFITNYFQLREMPKIGINDEEIDFNEFGTIVRIFDKQGREKITEHEMDMIEKAKKGIVEAVSKKSRVVLTDMGIIEDVQEEELEILDIFDEYENIPDIGSSITSVEDKVGILGKITEVARSGKKLSEYLDNREMEVLKRYSVRDYTVDHHQEKIIDDYISQMDMINAQKKSEEVKIDMDSFVSSLVQEIDVLINFEEGQDEHSNEVEVKKLKDMKKRAVMDMEI